MIFDCFKSKIHYKCWVGVGPQKLNLDFPFLNLKFPTGNKSTERKTNRSLAHSGMISAASFPVLWLVQACNHHTVVASSSRQRETEKNRSINHVRATMKKTSTKFPRSGGSQRIFPSINGGAPPPLKCARQQRRLYLCTTRRIPVTSVSSCIERLHRM